MNDHGPSRLSPNATIESWKKVHDDLALLKVRPDQIPAPSFEPGQHIELGLDDGSGSIQWRDFSMASDARDSSGHGFCAVRITGGAWTQRLWEAGEGARIWMGPEASGTFTLAPVKPDAAVLMVATGTGVAPFMSMLNTCLDAPPWQRCVLVHGVRHRQDLAFDQALGAMALKHDGFAYVPVVSREPAFQGHRGHVGDVIHDPSFSERYGVAVDPTSSHVFLCGNPAMVDDQAEVLGERGFDLYRAQTNPSGRLHYEKYW